MEEFDPDLFSRLEDKRCKREGSLIELKQEIPCVIHDVNKLAKFVRNMIALANTARRRGEPAYMIYGVDNDGNLLPEGIKGQCTRRPKPQDWDDEDLDKLERQQNEIIGRDLHRQIRNYVRPEIEFDYLYGQVENQLVSYIKIRPSPVSEPFKVRRNLEDRAANKVLLRHGQCWKREGESKVEVPPHEQQFLYTWREVPYISKDKWLQHLSDMVLEYEDVDWERELYIHLMCEGAKNHPSLRERVNEFLATGREQVLIVKGRPGAGKSTFLRKLTHDLAEIAWQNLNVSSREEPEELAPVFVDLNGYVFYPQIPFKRDVALELDQFGHFELNTVPEPEKILTDRNLKFLVCLDALDEMKVQGWEDSVGAIQSFLAEFPNVKVIIATRPEAAPRWRRRCTSLTISSLIDEQIYGYLSAYLDDPDTLYEFLSSDDELFALMGIPLMIRAAVEYRKPSEERIFDFEEGEYIEEDVLLSIGGFVDHLFYSLFEHEKRKDPSPDRDIQAAQRLKSLSDLALYMDARIPRRTSLSKANEFIGTDLLRLRNMGVIRIQRHALTFFNELVQAYFAALGLKYIIEEEDNGISQALEKISNHSFWSKCLDILKDLTAESNVTLLEEAIASFSS
jgi:hypothetical protein